MSSSETQADQVRSITKGINDSLESVWSKTQLIQGKWFEIKDYWLPGSIQELVARYRAAGWIVSRHAELTSNSGTTQYLVIGHPRHHSPKKANFKAHKC